MDINLIFQISQIIIAAILVALILFQQRGTALGSAFGQAGGAYSTRRGIQRKAYIATIILGTLFIILAVADLLF